MKKSVVMDNPIPKSQWMSYLGELIHASMENRTPEMIPYGICLDEVIDIARRNQMNYPLLGALVKLPLEEDKLEQIRYLVQESMMRTLVQVMENQQISQKFEEAGIRHQMLKGSVMKFVYPKPEMREMGDIDCMLYEENFDKAEAILLSLGYEKVSAEKHHVVYRKGKYMVFEMHWDLYEKTVDKEQYIYYKDTFRARLKEGFQHTYEFSVEDFYVYMISHMAKHFYEQGCGIRNLLDIYIYQREYGDAMDQIYLKKELEKCGLIAFEYHARNLAFIWMDKKDSTDFYNYMFQYMVDCGIYGKAENGVWGQLAKQDDFHFVSKINFIFPNYDYMVELYPKLEGRKIFLPVFWVLRGIKGITDVKARERMKMLKQGEKIVRYEYIYRLLQLNFHR